MKDSPIRLGITLFIIAAICGLILGAANVITKDVIAAEKDAANKQAFEAVMPEGGTLDMMKELEIPQELSEQILEAYEVGEYGYVMKAVNKGYGGNVTIAVGLDASGAVTGVKIVEHSESAGLGANAEKESFTNQYLGKNAEIGVAKASPSDTEIQAISGATITSKCVTKSVNAVLSFYQSLKGGATK